MTYDHDLADYDSLDDDYDCDLADYDSDLADYDSLDDDYDSDLADYDCDDEEDLLLKSILRSG